MRAVVGVPRAASEHDETEALRRRVRELEKRQAVADAAVEALTVERDNLRRVYEKLGRQNLNLVRGYP